MTFYRGAATGGDSAATPGHLSYRALKRQFQLDDACLEDLKVELIEVQRLAIDQDGTMLVCTGNAPVVQLPAAA